MTITSVETLIVFLIGFGIFGCVRGPEREMWTLGGITMTMLLVFFGGTSLFEQLPLRVAAGITSLIGDQEGSNSIASHPLQAPWTIIMLVVCVAGLVVLSYVAGQRFGKAPPEKRDFGNLATGLLVGALNGTCIGVFLFSQGGFQAGINIQFPDSGLTRSSIVPLILVGIVVMVIAVSVAARKPRTGTP
jgi:hypothetical protein